MIGKEDHIPHYKLKTNIQHYSWLFDIGLHETASIIWNQLFGLKK